MGKTKQYRINGFEQLQSYIQITQSNIYPLKPHHHALYLYFIVLNNSQGWVEWFRCTYESALNGSGIGSQKTYYKALREMKEFGLIDYKKGINNLVSPLIHLKCLGKNAELHTAAMEEVKPKAREEQHTEVSAEVSADINISNNNKLLNNNSLSNIDESESFFKNNKTDMSIKTQVSRQEENEFTQGTQRKENAEDAENSEKREMMSEGKKHTPLNPLSIDGNSELEKFSSIEGNNKQKEEKIELPWKGDKFFKAWCDFVYMTMRVRKQKKKEAYTKSALEAKLKMLVDKTKGNEKLATDTLIRLTSLEYLDIEIKNNG